MNETELTAVLEEAGFSPYQAEAYVAILELGAAAATDIADESGVPDQRIYDVLSDLEEAGYVETYEQQSLRARIHDFGPLREALESRAARFTEAVEEIEHRWEKPPVEETVFSFVTRFETVFESAVEAIENAETHVQIAARPDHYRELRSALRAATDNGVSVHLSLLSGEGTEPLPDTEELSSVCTEARVRRLPAPFVSIVDRSKVCFSPHAGSTNEYGLIVDDRTHAYVFHWFFLTTQWDVWEQLYASTDESFGGNYLDIRYCVRDIEPLLASGRTVGLLVEGVDTETGDDLTVEGTVQDVVVDPDHGETGRLPIVTYGGRVAVVLETETGPVEVGGWGAFVEDVEAHRIRVTSIE